MTFKEKNHEWISLTLKTTSLILDNLTRDEGMYGIDANHYLVIDHCIEMLSRVQNRLKYEPREEELDHGEI